jgi:hypothetical protein
LSEFLQSDQGIITATSVENLTALLSIVEQIDTNSMNAIKRYPLVVLSPTKRASLEVCFNRIFI